MKVWAVVLVALLWLMSGRLMAADTVQDQKVHIVWGNGVGVDLPAMGASGDQYYYGWGDWDNGRMTIFAYLAEAGEFDVILYDSDTPVFEMNAWLTGDFNHWTSFSVDYITDLSAAAPYVSHVQIGDSVGDMTAGAGNFQVPEPAAAGMLAVGSLCLLARKSRRV